MRAYIKETKKVVSYPRLLLEEKLGRALCEDEQVHHVDGDLRNNDISNLEVMRLGEHQQHHSPAKYRDMIVNCTWCGKEFLWTAKQQRYHYSNGYGAMEDYHFCSKSCVGKYGTTVQYSHAGVSERNTKRT